MVYFYLQSFLCRLNRIFINSYVFKEIAIQEDIIFNCSYNEDIEKCRKINIAFLGQIGI